jgi:hypothetical protein
MYPPTPNPTETSHEREALLWQEARGSRVTRWGRAIARAVLVLLVVGILAAIVVGLEGFGYWVGTFIIPAVVTLGVVITVLALLVWEIERIPAPPFRDRLQ